MATDSTSSSTPTAPMTPGRGARWAARLGWWLLLPVLVLTLLAAAGTAAGLRWLLYTHSGAQWALARTPGVEVEGLEGALLGPELRVTRLSFPAGAHRVTVEGLHAQGLVWHFRPQPGVWMALDAQHIIARRVTLRRGPPSAPPTSLEFPFRVALQTLQVDEFLLDDLPPVQALTASGLSLDSAGAGSHGAQALALRFRGYALSGRARIGAAAPLPLQADISIVPPSADSAASAPAGTAASAPAGTAASAPSGMAASAPAGAATPSTPPPWSAQISASGPLQLLDLNARLRGEPAAGSRPGAAAPALDLQARVAPFAAWPLNALQLQTEALDLSALAAGAPQTSLSGTAQVQANAADAPITATIDLRNALPGRWNEGRLPVRELALELQGSASARDQLTARRVDVQLADATGTAGRWTGAADWRGHVLSVDTQLLDVLPQRLDSRAAPMRLAGPLKLELTGMPALGQPAGTAGGAPPTERPPWSAVLQLQLDGRLQDAPAPVRLNLRASGDAQLVQIEELRAQSGAAVAELQATLRRLNMPAGPGGRRTVPGWRLQTSGKLLDFDPLPWWPGEVGSAWRQGPHRLSAGWSFDMRLPHSALKLAPLSMVQRVAGQGSLQLNDALVAGVPLRGELSLDYGAQTGGSPMLRRLLDAWAQPAAPGSTAASQAMAGTTPAAALGRVQADLNFGGNHLQLAAQGDPLGDGDADHWALDLRADALTALAPLARLHPALADWVPRQGSLNVQMGGDGRWPSLRTQGKASLMALKIGALAVDAAQADWRLDSRSGDPQRSLDMQLRVDGLQQGTHRLAQLQATAGGTLASHRINLDATGSQTPPAWLEKMMAVPRRQGTRATVRAEGSWTAQPQGGGSWRARVERLAAAPWTAPPSAGAATLAAKLVPAAPLAADASGTPGAPGRAVQPVTGAQTGAQTGALWAEALDLRAELDFDASGALARVRAEPGQLRLADVAAVRWDAVRVDLTGPRPLISLNATLDPLDVAPFLDRAMPGIGWAGDLRLGGSARIDAAERFEAELVLERLGGDLYLDGEGGLQLLGLTDVRVGLLARDGVWNFRQAFVGRSLGQLGANLRVRTAPENRWPEPTAPVEGSIEARVKDIGVWGSWVPPGWRLIGAVSTVAQVSGEFGAPKFTGNLSGTGLGVRNLLQGVNVTDGRIQLSLDGDSARIEAFTLRGGDGTLTITGGATFGKEPQADLTVKADKFRVLGRVDRQLITSGDAQLRLQRDLIKLDGRLRVDEGLFDASRADAPSLDSDVSIRSAQDFEDRADEPPVARANTRLVVTLDVNLGEGLRVRGRGLDTQLRGQLRITTPGGRLAVNGTVRTERGTYAAYGQKLEIERGIVAFSGTADNPRLDVLALRPNVDIRVGVAIAGTLQAPRVRLYAEPEMGETDKLSWLVLGRAPDGLGRADTALLQRAAVALLAGEGGGPTDELMRNLGIDDLSLRQDEGDTRQTVITLGKQLSRRWYLGYERGVNATTGTWQLIYRIAQRLTVRAQSGLENALDIIWVWRVGEVPDVPVPKSGPPSATMPAPAADRPASAPDSP
jgi:translocation and assembly module TamB